MRSSSFFKLCQVARRAVSQHGPGWTGLWASWSS